MTEDAGSGGEPYPEASLPRAGVRTMTEKDDGECALAGAWIHEQRGKGGPVQRRPLTYGSVLRSAAPFLPEGVLSPAGLQSIERVAGILPASAIELFGFETQLGGGVGVPDCAFNLTPDGAARLAGSDPLPAPGAAAVGSWAKIQAFYRAWGDTRVQRCFSDAGATWLEFDAASAELAPNLLFGYWPDNTDTRRPLPWLTGTILPMLLGMPLSPAFANNLRRCFESHPGGGDFQIGAMLARSIPAVRVCVFDLAPDQVSRFLGDIGWPGEIAAVQGYVDRFAAHADFVALHLDVGEQVYPRMGIEPGFTAGPWARQPHLEPRWHGQLDALIELGLCTPEERDGLLAWVGYQDGAAMGLRPDQVLLRGLSHIKVTAHQGAEPLAKAYFGLSLRSVRSPSRGGP